MALAPARRPAARVALPVAAFGVLVLLAVLFVPGGESEARRDHGDAAAALDMAAEQPVRAEAVTTHRPVVIPTDPVAWKVMSETDLESVGRRVAETTPGFRFDRVEVFSGGGQTNAIAVLAHEKTELEFSLIPPGEFAMGDPAAAVRGTSWGPFPAHTVVLSSPFLLGRAECTVGAFARGEDAPVPVAAARTPITRVTWRRARSWCRALGLRLPSEAEWEYACRAGTTTRFWSGDNREDLDAVGWFSGNPPIPGSRTCVDSVGRWPANPFGLHDAHGNAMEWCEDSWHDTYEGAPTDGTAWVEQETEYHILRSGVRGCSPCVLASSERHFAGDQIEILAPGFRPAATVVID